MVETLNEVLSAYKVATLATMVSFNGLSPSYQKGKDAYLQALVELFSSRQHIQQVYEILLPVEREAVDALIRRSGQMSTYALFHHLGKLRLIDTSGEVKPAFHSGQPDLHQRNPRRLEEIMARLQAYGLVFAVPGRNGYGQEISLDFNLVQEYFIPDDIRDHLPKPAPVSPWRPPGVPAPERIAEGSARTFQRDLYFYWSFVRANPLQLTAKGLVLKRHLTALNETLLLRETIGTGQVENDFPDCFSFVAC